MQICSVYLLLSSINLYISELGIKKERPNDSIRNRALDIILCLDYTSKLNRILSYVNCVFWNIRSMIIVFFLNKVTPNSTLCSSYWSSALHRVLRVSVNFRGRRVIIYLMSIVLLLMLLDVRFTDGCLGSATKWQKKDPKHPDFFIPCAWFLIARVLNHTILVIYDSCFLFSTQFANLKKKGKGVLYWLKLPSWKTDFNFSDTSGLLSTWLGFFCMSNFGVGVVVFCFVLFFILWRIKTNE